MKRIILTLGICFGSMAMLKAGTPEKTLSKEKPGTAQEEKKPASRKKEEKKKSSASQIREDFKKN